MAVCYLNTAIRLANMASLVLENPVVLSQDESFSTPLSAGAYLITYHVCMY